jgi:parvulin-like peptidyl-prolyl isomerase
MPNALIANAAFNFTPGETGSIYDEAAVKEVAYWLIKVTGKQDNEIDALVMLLGSEAQAEQIKAELAAGGNFSALAQQYSQHSSKSKGGNLTGLKPGDMGSAIFDTAAFNATINIVSDPVKDKFFKTAGGYWLVRVLERGEHELTEETRDDLIDWRYNDWRQEFAGKSTIKTYLEANKITWAINKVLEDR